MPFKIVRNDITKMEVDAIVNTANPVPSYSTGVDKAIYHAAGVEKLLAARQEIGFLNEGDVAVTPGFALPSKYIFHAVSPRYMDGESGEAEKLRSCYEKSLELAAEYDCKSIAFPLISTGNFGYPKEEAMRIALDEIHSFLFNHDILVYLVVFDTVATKLGLNVYPALEAYIDHHYVCEKREEEYGDRYFNSIPKNAPGYDAYHMERLEMEEKLCMKVSSKKAIIESDMDPWDFYEENESELSERMKHLSDTFQEYLMYLIKSKGLKNVDVYKKAYMTKQLFSKIKTNPKYQPDKGTAIRLCVGAKLNLDETKDLLARAGFALSPADKRDVIFSFFIENGVYDLLEIDIVLEDYGLKTFIE